MDANDDMVQHGGNLVVGLDDDRALVDARSSGFAFSTAPLLATSTPHTPSFTYTDLTIHDGTIIIIIMVTFILEHVDLAVAKIVPTADGRLIEQQIEWCAHLGLTAIEFSVVAFGERNLATLARYVAMALARNTVAQVWIRVPLNQHDSWLTWHKLRSYCDHHTRLFVSLEFSQDVPNKDAFNRWCAEPVKVLCFPDCVWLQNKSGFPVLSKQIQQYFLTLSKYHCHVMLSGASFEKCCQQFSYMRHLYSQRPTPSAIEAFAQGYEDTLQAPLQPLMDNLEMTTYNVFTKDPIKYQLYEEASERALRDRLTSLQKNNSSEPICVMVVGAGARGPLVSCFLRALNRVRMFEVVPVRLYVLEKNPNAIVTLLREKKINPLWIEMGEDLEVVHSDMRFWQPSEKADIMISELLGSFGDNELSPECLAPAQTYLKSKEEDGCGEGGVMIPESYTSYVSLLSSEQLYANVKSYKSSKHFEMPYVVYFHRCNILTPPQPVWTFYHPTSDTNNTRESHISFTLPDSIPSALVHGLAGFFECTLYTPRHSSISKSVSTSEDSSSCASAAIKMSIHPDTHSPDMTSWFPIFFPFQCPILLQPPSSSDSANTLISVSLRRVVDERRKKCWYEWSYETEGYVSVIHNMNGRSYEIGL